MMQKLMSIAVTNIAGNITAQPAFMTIVINDHKYSTARKRTPFILKALNEGAAAHGRLTITANRVSFADEKNRVFQTLAPTPVAITSVTLGLHRTMVNQLGAAAWFKARYTLIVTIQTPSATYRLLNTDLKVVPALIKWTQDYHLTLNDPLHLSQNDFDLTTLTIDQFEAMTKGTPYFAWCQTIGAPIKSD